MTPEQSRRLDELRELIDMEVETIMYTCAPMSVKMAAVKRRDAYIAERDRLEELDSG